MKEKDTLIIGLLLVAILVVSGCTAEDHHYNCCKEKSCYFVEQMETGHEVCVNMTYMNNVVVDISNCFCEYNGEKKVCAW